MRFDFTFSDHIKNKHESLYKNYDTFIPLGISLQKYTVNNKMVPNKENDESTLVKEILYTPVRDDSSFNDQVEADRAKEFYSDWKIRNIEWVYPILDLLRRREEGVYKRTKNGKIETKPKYVSNRKRYKKNNWTWSYINRRNMAEYDYNWRQYLCGDHKNESKKDFNQSLYNYYQTILKKIYWINDKWGHYMIRFEDFKEYRKWSDVKRKMKTYFKSKLDWDNEKTIFKKTEGIFSWWLWTFENNKNLIIVLKEIEEWNLSILDIDKNINVLTDFLTQNKEVHITFVLMLVNNILKPDSNKYPSSKLSKIVELLILQAIDFKHLWEAKYTKLLFKYLTYTERASVRANALKWLIEYAIFHSQKFDLLYSIFDKLKEICAADTTKNIWKILEEMIVTLDFNPT